LLEHDFVEDDGFEDAEVGPGRLDLAVDEGMPRRSGLVATVRRYRSRSRHF
jgi:hypothetical protein